MWRPAAARRRRLRLGDPVELELEHEAHRGVLGAASTRPVEQVVVHEDDAAGRHGQRSALEVRAQGPGRRGVDRVGSCIGSERHELRPNVNAGATAHTKIKRIPGLETCGFWINKGPGVG